MCFSETGTLPPPYLPTQREAELAQRLHKLSQDIQGADDHRRGYNIARIHGITLRPEMTLAEAAAEGLRYASRHLTGTGRSSGIC